MAGSAGRSLSDSPAGLAGLRCLPSMLTKMSRRRSYGWAASRDKVERTKANTLAFRSGRREADHRTQRQCTVLSFGPRMGARSVRCGRSGGSAVIDPKEKAPREAGQSTPGKAQATCLQANASARSLSIRFRTGRPGGLIHQSGRSPRTMDGAMRRQRGSVPARLQTWAVTTPPYPARRSAPIRHIQPQTI